MTVAPDANRAGSGETRLRVGLFGRLGSGNMGNDGTLEAMLRYLRTEHPDAALDCLCTGPGHVTARYGLHAADLHWDRGDAGKWPGPLGLARKVVRVGVGVLVDTWRTARWVRRHSVIIVPGMGTLESSLALRPWQMPLVIFVLGASGRLFGTKVALVSVGATSIDQPLTRWLLVNTARLATYRSFRDDYSRDVLGRMGVDTAADEVYPDMVFSLPAPPPKTSPTGTVGVGIIAWYGTTADRSRAEELHARYIATMRCFLRWLLDSGHRVRLFTGDDADAAVATRLRADIFVERPDFDPTRLVFDPVDSLDRLMEQMVGVDTMVASRYHNVVCALRCRLPTLAIGYSAKHDMLMERFGLRGCCLGIRDLDVDALKAAFTALEANRESIRASLLSAPAAEGERVADQFTALTRTLFTDAPARATADMA